jgi:hypothetical protein
MQEQQQQENVDSSCSKKVFVLGSCEWLYDDGLIKSAIGAFNISLKSKYHIPLIKYTRVIH